MKRGPMIRGMVMRGRAVAVLAALLWLAGAAGAARAQQAANDYAYVSGSAGWIHPLDVGTGNLGETVTRDDGATAHLAVGHSYHAFRGEAELGWAEGGAGSSGTANTGTLMINAYWDIDTGGPITPYIGLGGGFAYVDYRGITVPGLGKFRDYDFAIGYQGILGASWRLDDRFALFADYRYFDASNVKLENEAGVRVKLDDYGSHTVEIGFRYRL